MQLHLIILLFHLIIFISAISLAAGQPDLWAHECSNSYGNYTSNSTYKSNLDKLLTYISTTNNIPYGFYSFSSGVDPNQVNAIALCRGDVVNVSVCHACLNFLKSNLTNLCPTQMEAIGWAEKCMLRYSKSSILGGVWSNHPLYNLDSRVDAEGDVDHFRKVVQDLLMSLPNTTADGDLRLKFATGEAKLNGSHKVYGLMQCTPDLNPSDCLGCLYWGMYYVLHVDIWKTGMRILLPSCSIRYELQKFYVSPPPPQPATPPLSAKSGDYADFHDLLLIVISGNGVKQKSVTLIVVGVLVCLFLFVVFLVWFFLRRRRRTNPGEFVELNNAWKNWGNKTSLNIVDATIASSDSVYEMERCIHIALLCIQESASSRPQMSRVLHMLSGESSLASPSQPPFINNSSNSPLPFDHLLQSISSQSSASDAQLSHPI
ncbi:hypothetical protein V2J09_019349 [Rumex salicifolius]